MDRPHGLVKRQIQNKALDTNGARGSTESSGLDWGWGLWNGFGLVRLWLRGDIVPWLPGLWNWRSTRRCRLLPVSGVLYLFHQWSRKPNIPTLGYETRGGKTVMKWDELVREMGCRGEPQYTKSSRKPSFHEQQCHLYIFKLPFQWAIQDGCFLHGRMRGTLTGVETPDKIKFLNFCCCHCLWIEFADRLATKIVWGSHLTLHWRRGTTNEFILPWSSLINWVHRSSRN